MPYDLTEVLVVGISSRALFDLRKEDLIYAEEGLEAYSRYQIANEDEPLAPGAGFALVRALLHLNGITKDVLERELERMSAEAEAQDSSS